MPAGEVETQAVQRQLERILESPGFKRNERLSRFLRLAVERHLDGRDHELKETVIAVEVFGRPADYNPKQDPIVRTEASRLRTRLAEYYAGEGKGDRIVIDLPKGAYAARIQNLEGNLQESITPRLRRSGWIAAGLAVLLVSISAGIVLSSVWPKSVPVTVAVLPLENLNHDAATDYFADGLTDELIRDLTTIDGLTPRSRTSSFAFKGKPRDIRDVGKQLGADYILEGSVLRERERLRINVQLVRVVDDFPLWSGKFNRELTDVFAIQEEISRGVVNSLRLKLGRGRRRYEGSPEAYDVYLRARAMPIRIGLSGFSKSIPLFEEAIAKDHAFAPAYAGLAAARAARSGQFRFDIADEAAKMRAAAEKAIELDPLLAEAHDALAMAWSRDSRWALSESSFRRAIELDPGRSSSYVHFAMFLLLPLGRIPEAIEHIRSAEEVDPLSPEVYFAMGYVLTSAGKFDEAARYCEKLPTGHPERTRCLGRARLGQGQTEEAIRIMNGKLHNGYLGFAYARAGLRNDAENQLALAYDNHFAEAVIYAGLGDKDRTLEALDRAAVTGPFRMGRALTWPELAIVRGDPRVRALRQKVGLPE